MIHNLRTLRISFYFFKIKSLSLYSILWNKIRELWIKIRVSFEIFYIIQVIQLKYFDLNEQQIYDHMFTDVHMFMFTYVHMFLFTDDHMFMFTDVHMIMFTCWQSRSQLSSSPQITSWENSYSSFLYGGKRQRECYWYIHICKSVYGHWTEHILCTLKIVKH